MTRLACSLLALTLIPASCSPKRTGAPDELPGSAQPVRIPKGCERNLSGTYVHASAAQFRYRVTDASPTVRIEREAVTTEGAPAPTFDLSVTRTSAGFKGEVTTQRTQGDVSCPLQFPVEITDCSEKSVTLRTLPAIDIDDGCQVIGPAADNAQWAEHTLTRLE